MTWVRVDDGFYEHQKFWELPSGAGWLWIRALAWANRNLSDGVIPGFVLGQLAAKKKDADILVAAGLWETFGNGWRFHDYHDFQPSAEQVRRNRAQRSEAGKRGASVRWDGKSHDESDSESHGKSDANCMARGAYAPDPSPSITSLRVVTSEPEPVENLQGREEAVAHARARLRPSEETA